MECESSIAPGGSALTHMLSLTAHHLADRYPETGCATVDDVARYREFLADPACWGTHFAIIRVLARAPAAAASASRPAL